MKHLKLKKAFAFLLIGTFTLTPYMTYASQKESFLEISSSKETSQLKGITVSEKGLTLEQGTSEQLFREKIEVKAWYNQNDYKAVTNYETNYEKIKDLPGKHNVIIIYTENNITKQACITVCISKKYDIDTSKEIKHISYLKGYEDGTFRANGYITRGEMATMLGRLLLDGKEPQMQNIFSDTLDTRYSTAYIAYVVQQGVMPGYEDGTFKPEQAVTRTEMTTISNVLKQELKMYANTMDLAEEGNVTRAEAVTILNKLFHRECSDVEISNPYTDLSSDFWAYNDIMYASIEHTHTVLNAK